MQQAFSFCLICSFIYHAAAVLAYNGDWEEKCLLKRVVWRVPQYSCVKHYHNGTGPPTLEARMSKVFDSFDSKWFLYLFPNRKDRLFINVTKRSFENEYRNVYLSLLLKEDGGTETTLIHSQALHPGDDRVQADTSRNCSEFESRGPSFILALPKNMTVTLHLWTDEWDKEKCATCFKTSAQVASDGGKLCDAGLESTSTLQKNFEDLLMTEDVTRVMSLYYVADDYKIPSLKRMCIEALKSSLSIIIVSDVISFSTAHNEYDLLQSAETFFSKHMEEILVTEEWQRFLASYPSQANTLYLKTVKTHYKKID